MMCGMKCRNSGSGGLAAAFGYAEIQSDERVGKPDVSGTRLATSNRGKVIIKMPDVMDQLSKTRESACGRAPAAHAPALAGQVRRSGHAAAGSWRSASGPGSISAIACRPTMPRWTRTSRAIAPKIPGNVLEVLVLDNQPVKAGDVLVRIDPRDYQARVDIARAALVQAQSQLHTAQTVVPL